MGKPDGSCQPDAYEVGFAKPPQRTQFRKGASGNPKGRPKGSKSMASILTKVGRQRVRVCPHPLSGFPSSKFLKVYFRTSSPNNA